MAQKQALGSNPLSWIGEKKSKQSKQSKQADLVTSNRTGATTEAGCKTGYTRATLHLRKEYRDKLKAVAYWDRKDIKDIVDEALENYFKGKKVKPLPEQEQ